MLRNLILTGGVYHPFDDASEALASLLREAGFESVITTDVHDAFRAAAAGEYDLLTVLALRWPMRGERFDAERPRWGVELTETDHRHVMAHLNAGRGVLALHTASICFDDWPGWRDTVGAGWIWGTSYHPPYGKVESRIAPVDHPITKGLPDFEIQDEAYTGLDMVEGIEPLATIRAQGQEAFSPSLWAREVGAARVVYDALGHDRQSLEHPVHRSIVKRSALWAVRRSDAEIGEMK